jgi:hypothetical protein
MRSKIAAFAFCTLMIPSLGFAKGNGTWKANHPRRAEVNQRLNNQNARIRDGVEDGKLTHGQAAQLHAEDHAIRQEERAMAAQNGGHITKTEQRALNQQENQTSRQIYNEKHPQ